jgi:hypothetical protein
MSDEPVAVLPDAMWELGDQPTDEFFEDSDGDSEVLVIEYPQGAWVARRAIPAQPFPCEDECSGCRVGRIAARAFREEAAVEHLLYPPWTSHGWSGTRNCLSHHLCRWPGWSPHDGRRRIQAEA